MNEFKETPINTHTPYYRSASYGVLFAKLLSSYLYSPSFLSCWFHYCFLPIIALANKKKVSKPIKFFIVILNFYRSFRRKFGEETYIYIYSQ